MGNWSDLPTDLLLQIVSHTTIKDQVVVRAVCTHWGAVLIEKDSSCRDQLPWLLIPVQEDPKRYGFYDISEEKIYPIDIPEAAQTRCCGSSHGWLVIAGMDPSVFLFNPLSRSRIELPPLTTLPHIVDYCPSRTGEEYSGFLHMEGEYVTYYPEYMKIYGIGKAVLTGNPTLEKDYAVVLTYSELQFLGFCWKGDAKWTMLTLDCSLDIIYWKGLLYSVDSQGLLLGINLEGPLPIIDKLINVTVSVLYDHHNYLVASGDDLLLVSRVYDKYSVEMYEDLVHCGGHCPPEDEEGNNEEEEVVEGDENSDNISFCTVRF